MQSISLESLTLEGQILEIATKGRLEEVEYNDANPTTPVESISIEIDVNLGRASIVFVLRTDATFAGNNLIFTALEHIPSPPPTPSGSLISPNNMTANNAPSPYIVRASSEFNENYKAYLAVDGLVTGSTGLNAGWLSGSSNGGNNEWWDIYLGEAKQAASYQIAVSYLGENTSPKSWTLSSSDNGIDWTVIDTRSNVNDWVASEYKTFTLANLSNKPYYRLTTTAPVGAPYVSIAELKLIS